MGISDAQPWGRDKTLADGHSPPVRCMLCGPKPSGVFPSFNFYFYWIINLEFSPIKPITIEKGRC